MIKRVFKSFFSTAFLLPFLLLISLFIGQQGSQSWILEKVELDVFETPQGQKAYIFKEKEKIIPKLVPLESSQLKRFFDSQNQLKRPPLTEEYISVKEEPGERYFKLKAKSHFGFWSLLPALTAVLLCWVSKEPIISLLGGTVAGALILGKFDLTGQVLIQHLGNKQAASVLVLYLWLLGGLLGIWSKTGAAKAFAEFMTRKFVRGPKSAKLVAWGLGVLFFQGGTMSTVLVGTTVKPIADKEKVSHEELSYIVDSTASPIASQLAFNAWPSYVQAFIFVAGVPFLATEALRITFFFKSVPFCFYAILAVLGTFLLAIEKPLFLGSKMRQAIDRARKTGELDGPDASPLSSKEVQSLDESIHYKASVWEFFLPLLLLISIAIGTFIFKGSPNVLWAFGGAILLASFQALFRGMSLKELMDGFHNGLKSVVLGSVILLLAMTIGAVSKEVGGGLFLIELFKEGFPYWLLPVALQVVTIIISFSTGTSWGTYAVAFPLAMPLAWAIAGQNGLAHPELFMTICFAAVMDGSVYGDQCSPISDTTVLSSMCTGCDLMDHVKTQIPQASLAALIAGLLWTLITVIYV